jgi:hypothetical protein
MAPARSIAAASVAAEIPGTPRTFYRTFGKLEGISPDT